MALNQLFTYLLAYIFAICREALFRCSRSVLAELRSIQQTNKTVRKPNVMPRKVKGVCKPL